MAIESLDGLIELELELELEQVDVEMIAALWLAGLMACLIGPMWLQCSNVSHLASVSGRNENDLRHRAEGERTIEEIAKRARDPMMETRGALVDQTAGRRSRLLTA